MLLAGRPALTITIHPFSCDIASKPHIIGDYFQNDPSTSRKVQSSLKYIIGAKSLYCYKRPQRLDNPKIAFGSITNGCQDKLPVMFEWMIQCLGHRVYPEQFSCLVESITNLHIHFQKYYFLTNLVFSNLYK